MTAASTSPVVQIVDDDDGVRESLALLVATVDLRVVAWKHPQVFLDSFDRDAIGAILLDVRMPGISGLSVLETLRAQGVDQPIVMLTGHGTVELCRRAFKSGATEFLEKPVDDDKLLEALHTAVRAHGLSRERVLADRESRQRVARLSERERGILALVVAGHTNKEIARMLGLSPRTVETHRANLSAKLEVASLAQLIRRYGDVVGGTA